jgi:hypothetical protein
MTDLRWNAIGVAEPAPGSAAEAAEWLEIAGSQVSSESAILRLRVYGISADRNADWIARFENASPLNPVPGKEDRRAQVKGRLIRTEMHFWFQIDGRWKVSEKKIAMRPLGRFHESRVAQ